MNAAMPPIRTKACHPVEIELWSYRLSFYPSFCPRFVHKVTKAFGVFPQVELETAVREQLATVALRAAIVLWLVRITHHADGRWEILFF